ncbi:MAG TPA: hypothetical protein VG206_24995 [Terriglobia bacterium]|nr:hypothetical protein [Terriglobia bacterium]
MVFLASFSYLYLFRRYTMMEPDEGIILQGAERILRGQVPYRDFFSFYTPGSYYLTALLFKILGDSVLVARTALAFCGGVFSVVTYLLARRVCRWATALLTAALVTLTCLPYRFLVLHNWYSTLWTCLAVYCAVRYQETVGAALVPARTRAPAWRWAFATGTLVAITALFEQSKGAGLALGLAAGFGLVAVGRRWTRASAAVTGLRRLMRKGDPRHSRESLNPVPAQTGAVVAAGLVPASGRANWLALAVGLAWPFLLTFAWFGTQHSLSPMLADWLWPLRHYSSANSVPYGHQDWSESSRATLFGSGHPLHTVLALLVVFPGFLVPVLPLIAVGVLVYQVIYIRLPLGSCLLPIAPCPQLKGEAGGADEKRPGDMETREDGAATAAMSGPRAHYILISAAISGLLLSVLVVRADIIHFMYLAPLSYLVLAWISDGGGVPSGVFHALRPAVRALALVCFGLFALVLLLRSVGAGFTVKTRRGVISSSAPDTVLEYVQAHVAPGSTILVYPYLPLYYYLTDSFSPAPFDYIQPGMHTPQQSAEVVRDLDAAGTAVALYEYRFDEKISSSWPNTAVAAIAVDPVADYLLAHYRACKVLRSASGWRFLFMVRKGLACPRP